MGCYYRLTATIPIIKGSESASLAMRQLDGTDTNSEDFGFEASLSESGDTIEVSASGHMSYGSAVALDDLMKDIYKNQGDHSRVLVLESQCDDEYNRQLLAPKTVLLAFRIAEAEAEIEKLQEMVQSLKETPGSDELEEFGEVLAG